MIGGQFSRASILFLALAPALQAQAVLGHVYRSGTRTPVEGAEVRVVGTDLVLESDSAGAFLLRELSSGWNVIQVRKVGYAVRADTVNVRDARTLERDFFLTHLDQLDTVKTVAARTRLTSPNLRAFEERRKNAVSGFFLTEEMLRANDGKSLAGTIGQHAAGLTIVASAQYGTGIASSRKICGGTALARGPCVPCYATVYTDGVLTYEFKPGVDLKLYRPIDFDRMAVTEFAAVEYYPGSGTGPPQYNATGSGCGLLLLWTRER